MKTKISLLICFLALALLSRAQLLAPETYNTKSFPAGSYPPGYVDPVDWTNTCFSYMGTVKFTSAYRFVTGQLAAVPGYGSNGWGGPAAGQPLNPSGNNNMMYGFSIPLVADLDGDGYPEILGIGAYSASLNGHYCKTSS